MQDRTNKENDEEEKMRKRKNQDVRKQREEYNNRYGNFCSPVTTEAVEGSEGKGEPENREAKRQK